MFPNFDDNEYEFKLLWYWEKKIEKVNTVKKNAVTTINIASTANNRTTDDNYNNNDDYDACPSHCFIGSVLKLMFSFSEIMSV